MIVIDTREPPHMESYFKAQGFTDVKLVRETLDIGDYLVKVSNYEIPVERKTATDFISSIEDGRLHSQLYAMSRNYPVSYVIVVGSISQALDELREHSKSDRTFSRKAFLSALVGASLKRAPDGCSGQVITLTVETDFDFAACVYYLHKKLERNDLVRLPPIKGKKTDYQACLVTLYSTLPGIGPERAKKLAQFFPSLESLMKASVREIASVDGIGLQTAKKIWEFLHSSNSR